MTTTDIKERTGRDSASVYGGAMDKRKVTVIVLVLWVVAAFLQSRLDPRRHYYTGAEPGRFGASLRNNMFGASFFGLREVVAGMLWVKADELFHEGKYQELVPYFSLVTFLDPHQVDVYSTGAWHLMYNFGDARMVPQGMAFLDDGIKNNQTVWDLWFQKGWVNFDWPVEDYDAALPNFQEAMKHKGTDGSPPPRYISHMIAHTLVRQGNIPAAEKQWRENIAFAENEMAAKDYAGSSEENRRFWQQERDVCRNNLKLVVLRTIVRKDLPQHPKHITLTVKPMRVGPRILHVAIRLTGLPPLKDSDGDEVNARMEVILQDKNYDQLVAQHSKDFTWIGKHLTRFRSIYNIVQSNGVVTDRGKPYVEVRMDKDPLDMDPPRSPLDLFPLDSEEYELIVRLDPRVRRQPEEVQDQFGWIGEGIAPGPDVVNGTHGARIIEKRITLRKDQIT